LGLHSKLENKDGAWEFISSMLSEEFQSGTPQSQQNFHFPILKSAHKAHIERAMQAAYSEENGVQIEQPKGELARPGWSVDRFAATESDIQAISDLINSADKSRVFNRQIMNIITEEAGAYFSGAKSAAEVVDIIENRVGIYVNEMK
jgi:ABC-type glycerol-3-phosphate transport system substrate-binding protein